MNGPLKVYIIRFLILKNMKTIININNDEYLLIFLQVQVLVHVKDVCLGSVTSIASGLKLNCTLSINPSHKLQAKEINLYTSKH